MLQSVKDNKHEGDTAVNIEQLLIDECLASTKPIVAPSLKKPNEALLDKLNNDPDYIDALDVKKISDKVNYHRNAAQWNDIKDKQELSKVIADEDVMVRTANIEELEQNEANRNHSTTFLFSGTEDLVRLVPGGLTYIVASTNQGKSTLACNIAAPIVTEGKKVLFLSNEESESDIRARVSCIRLGINYGNYTNGLTTLLQNQQIKEDVIGIQNSLITIGNGTVADKYRTQNADGMIKTIEKVMGKVDCIIIDYLQRVLSTDTDSSADWLAQKKLIVKLDSIKHMVGCPLIVFGQVQPLVPSKSKTDDKNAEFESHHPMYRSRGSKDAFLSATEIIEIFQDRGNKCTVLFAHKTRFRSENWVNNLTIGFIDGRFVPYTIDFQMKVSPELLDKETIDDSSSI